MSKEIRKDNLIITIYDGFGKARIEGIYGKPSELVIPNKISYYNKEYNIEYVSWEALKYGSEQVESLIIDKEIIGNYDLCDLFSLKSITIGENVKSIDSEFIHKKHLTSIVVNPNNKTYDSRNNCNAIIETCSNVLVVGCKNTIIPNSITRIGDYAFAYCKDLTSITIPNSVKSIGYNAFSGCAGLSAITFDCDIDYSTKIESTTIRSINIGKNVKKIYPECLNYPSRNSIIVDDKNSTYDSANNCNAIIETSNKTLVLGCPNTKIPNHIISIGKYAFSKCSLLTKITIPSSVTSIGYFAFSESSLKSIIIPHSVTDIGSCVFAKCTNINITVENSRKNINFENHREAWIDKVNFTLIDLETLIGSIIAYHTHKKNPRHVSTPTTTKGTTPNTSNRVTHGAWTLELAENKSVKIYKNGEPCKKTSPALRELATEIGFTYDPKWNTRQLGSNLFTHLIKLS